MTKSIDIVFLLRLVLRKWPLFTAVAAVSLIAAFAMTVEVRPTVYESYTTISSIAANSYKESVEGAAILQNYAELAQSSKIASAAKESIPGDFSAEEIKSMIRPSFNEDTTILYIYGTSGDPQTAISVANAVAEAFVAELGNITGGDSIKIYDRAVRSYMKYDGESEQRKMRLTIPAVSIFLAVVAVVLWALFSGKIRSVAEAGLGGEVAIIGVIPRK